MAIKEIESIEQTVQAAQDRNGESISVMFKNLVRDTKFNSMDTSRRSIQGDYSWISKLIAEQYRISAHGIFLWTTTADGITNIWSHHKIL